MIEGITTPFEPGQPPLTPPEQEAARLAFTEGLVAVQRQFGEGELDIEAVQEGTGAEITFAVIPDMQEVQAITPDVQLHAYAIGLDDIVRRWDGRAHYPVSSQPPEERFSGTNFERFSQTIDLHAKEEAMGLRHQPVSAKEVRALFALIARGTLDTTDTSHLWEE